jgi:hypothetical protein
LAGRCGYFGRRTYGVASDRALSGVLTHWKGLVRRLRLWDPWHSLLLLAKWHIHVSGMNSVVGKDRYRIS